MIGEDIDDSDADDHFAAAAELRSFGRRRGRRQSHEQARLMDAVLPRLSVDLTRSSPTDLGDVFAPREPISSSEVGCGDGQGHEGLFATPSSSTHRAIWLEIGFGGAEHLIAQARANPTVGLIGCEPFEEGVIKALAAIEADALANIRIYADDARTLLRWLPASSIDRAFILFPDPWPKRKHHKRRLVNRATLALLARVMRPGAELRIGTDIGDYVRSMMIEIAAEGSFHWRAEAPADWRDRPADWPETRYEQKAGREGRRCYYFRFERGSRTA